MSDSIYSHLSFLQRHYIKLQDTALDNIKTVAVDGNKTLVNLTIGEDRSKIRIKQSGKDWKEVDRVLFVYYCRGDRSIKF